MQLFLPLREAPYTQLAQFQTAENFSVVPRTICPWDEAIHAPSTSTRVKSSADSKEHRIIQSNTPSDSDNISTKPLSLVQGKVNASEDLTTR